MKRLILLPLFCAVVGIVTSTAQLAPGTIYLEHAAPPTVIANSRTQSSPWAGGADNPQMSLVDLNKDNVKDLVIFEPRKGIKTFINTSSVSGNPVYVYKPEYAANFPEVIDYCIMRDYNNDNIPDLFHRGYSGVSISKGYYNSSNMLCFKFYKALYYYLPFSGMVNVYVSPADFPIIDDVDNDGDIDVVSYDVLGTLMTFYRNCRIENGLPPDSFTVCVKDVCWGKVFQPWGRKFDSYSCTKDGTTCKTTKTTHAANTLCLIDYDNDGDNDFFDGNLYYSDIQLLINGKKNYSYPEDTVVAQDTIWSSNGKTMNMPMMPLANWMDVDNDGDKDLLFSPKAENTENHKCIAYFKNIGSTSSPNYVYQSDTFMIEDMIDAGSGAYPVLYDYDKDGKLDLFVGNDGYYQPATTTIRTAIKYYHNESSGTQTKFVLQTDDFLGQFASNSKGTAMSMGDLDGDGKDDLVIGKNDGTIQFFRNTAASATVQPVWQYVTMLNDQYGTLKVDTGINGGGYATPFIYDIDNDGKKDIVCGSQRGKVAYFRNTGGSVPAMYRVTDSLGGVGIQEDGNIYGFTAPYIGKIDNTGKEYLLVGSKSGILYRYDSVVAGNYKKYNRLDSGYSSIRIYDRATPYVADINGDGKYEMLVGNILGGVKMYEQYFNVGIAGLSFAKNGISVYPNPAKSIVHIVWKQEFVHDAVDISLVSVTGVKVWGGIISKDQTETEINVESLASGTYFCVVQSGSNKAITPISIVK